METKILTIILLISATAYSQVNRDDRKEAQKISRNHIRSKVIMDYPFAYDLNTGTYKVTAKGTKVESQTFDLKGNVIQEIMYDEYGNIGSKTISKYDDRGNSVEDVVYNSDGTISSKVVTVYRKDTIATIKVYNPDGTINITKYSKMVHWRDTDLKADVPYFNCYALKLFNRKDSTIYGEVKYMYDDAGNMIGVLSFSTSDGKTLYLTQKDGFKYNQKNEMIEHDYYGVQYDDITGYQKYKYDGNGNTIAVEANSYTWVYKNDARGMLVSVTKYDNNNNPVTLSKITYQ
jgi:hypothetical protein